MLFYKFPHLHLALPQVSYPHVISLSIINFLVFYIDGADFSIPPNTHVTLIPSLQQTTHSLSIQKDGVVLEGLETFRLELQWVSGQAVNELRPLEVTIVDTDGQQSTALPIVYCFNVFFTAAVLQRVACYGGGGCQGASPPIVDTIEDCCLQNISALTTFRTKDNVQTCQSCLGEWLYSHRTKQ